MPFEYRLMVTGHREQEKAALRREAGWMSYLMTGLVKEKVTAAQLLGEEASEEADRMKAAARRVDQILKKRRKLFGEGA